MNVLRLLEIVAGIVDVVVVVVVDDVVVVGVANGFPSHAVNNATAAKATIDLRITLLEACLFFCQPDGEAATSQRIAQCCLGK